MSGKRDLNFSLYSGRLTHPPEMMQYNTGHGHMLCFSLAIHSDAPSDKIDNPMFLDVKVTGASPELHQHMSIGQEVRVRGELQSRTFKKQDRIQRTYYLHVKHPPTSNSCRGRRTRRRPNHHTHGFTAARRAHPSLNKECLHL
ncbi:MAG: single-stranded DNA-binding protein [Nitrospira sp.]|nr:single-stranded DNA-binding protein [Nitrospira sp.]